MINAQTPITPPGRSPFDIFWWSWLLAIERPFTRQYFSTVILQKLELLKASQREVILGLLEDDLYSASTPFIVGDSDRIGSCAVVSYFRIRQEFYGLPEDERMVFKRILKESSKHLGRILGLTLCRNPRCVMYYSDNMFDIDQKCHFYLFAN